MAGGPRPGNRRHRPAAHAAEARRAHSPHLGQQGPHHGGGSAADTARGAATCPGEDPAWARSQPVLGGSGRLRRRDQRFPDCCACGHGSPSLAATQINRPVLQGSSKMKSMMLIRGIYAYSAVLLAVMLGAARPAAAQEQAFATETNRRV